MIKEVDGYVADVLSGKQVASLYVRQACQRHVRDLKTGAKRDLVFDEVAAKRALAFFAVLRHSKGEWAGKEFVLSPWQKFIIAMLFGWKVKSTGMRRFLKAYIEVARKNGKSTFLAGIGLYLLVADGEPGAEVYSAATKLDQAKIVHSEAIRMVKGSPLLKKEISIFKNNLNVAGTNSKYEPLGADSDTLDGLNVSGAIIDELHAHKTRGMVDILDTATGARRQPLIVEITTAGYDRLVCWEHRDYSRQILEGVIEDDTWFAFVATIDKDDDWEDPDVWVKANPNLGVSVKPEDLQRKARRAKKVPAEQNTFKRLHLDVWTEQANRWLDMDEWDGCEGDIKYDDPRYIERLRGRKCYAGLDLASTTDIAALELVFPTTVEPSEAVWKFLAPLVWPKKQAEQWPLVPIEVFDVLSYFWVPEATVEERTRKANVPYQSWVEQGLIQATEGNVIDYKAILVKFDELARMFDVAEVAYDRWGATQLIQDMQSAGLEVIPFGQGFVSMSPPTKELLNLVLARRLRHGGHPVLRWMASNVAVLQDPAGNLKPDKNKSSEKIDGMVALIEGIDRATRKEGPGDSVYEERGILVW